MNADEAWEEYSRGTEPIQKDASVAGKLETIQSQLNELETMKDMIATLSARIMGEDGAIAQANQMAAMMPPAAPAAPEGEPAPEEGEEPVEEPPAEAAGEEEESLEDAPIDYSDEGGIEEDELPPEEIPAEEDPAEEMPAEEVPADVAAELLAEGARQPDLEGAFEQLVDALKGVAHSAIDTNKLYIVDGIASAIRTLAEIWESRVCPLVDELNGSDEMMKSCAVRKSVRAERFTPIAKMDEAPAEAPADAGGDIGGEGGDVGGETGGDDAGAGFEGGAE